MMILSIILRSAAVYVFILLAIRFFGKRELTQLSITDLIFILLISNSVQNAMVGPDSTLLGGIIAAGTLFVVNYIFGLIFYKSKKIAGFFEGHPLMLIYNGHEIKENLDKAELSHEELEAAVREHGVENISEVNLAILEVDGNVSVLSDNFKHKTTKHRRAHKAITKMQ